MTSCPALWWRDTDRRKAMIKVPNPPPPVYLGRVKSGGKRRLACNYGQKQNMTQLTVYNLSETGMGKISKYRTDVKGIPRVTQMHMERCKQKSLSLK